LCLKQDLNSNISILKQAAKQHSITLVGGSIPESSGGNVYNTCLVYDKAGQLLAKHRKVRCVHLTPCQTHYWGNLGSV